MATQLKNILRWFAGVGDPQNGDLLVTKFNDFKINSLYVNKTTGLVWIRNAANGVAADWESMDEGSPGGGGVGINGLSVDIDGNLVLGQDYGAPGDPAKLLSDREIPMDGFGMTWRNGADPVFIIDPSSGITVSNGGVPYFSIDANLQQFQLGDFTGAGGGASILIDNSPSQFQFFDNVGMYLYLDPSGFYELGDISGTLNNTYLSIDDTLETFTFSSFGSPWVEFNPGGGDFSIGDIAATASGLYSYVNINGGGEFAIQTATGRFLTASPASDTYQIGDIDATNNNTKFSIDDASQLVTIGSMGFDFLYMDLANQVIQLGGPSAFNGMALIIDDGNRFTRLGQVFGSGNGTELAIDDIGQAAYFWSGGFNHFLIDVPNRIYKLGDIQNTQGGNTLIIDDLAAKLTFGTPFVSNLSMDRSTGLYQIGDILGAINGTFLRINDTTQRVTISNVPEFADNAAAVGAGLTTGMIYRTGDGVKIVHP